MKNIYVVTHKEARISITTDGVAVGIARCRKNESFDAEFGAALAKARMENNPNNETDLLLENYNLRDTKDNFLERGGYYNIKTLDGDKIRLFKIDYFDGKTLFDNEEDDEIAIADIKKLKRKN